MVAATALIPCNLLDSRHHTAGPACRAGIAGPSRQSYTLYQEEQDGEIALVPGV